MVGSIKNAIRRRGVRSRDALLQRLEGELDGVYDLIYQMFGDEEQSLLVLERVLRRATALSRRERYERYLRLWAFGVAVEAIRRAYPRFLAERTEDQAIPLEALTMEEKLLFFLHDRAGLSYEEISAVTQIPVGRAGRCLTYAREKVAGQLGLRWETKAGLALRERSQWNRALDESFAKGVPEDYLTAMAAARASVSGLPARRFSEIEASVRDVRLRSLLGHPRERVRWQDLSWRHKLGLEASLLAVVGFFSVAALPWMLSRVDTTAFVEGRFADVLQAEAPAGSAAQAEGITTDRLLASSSEAVEERAAEDDEFADVEFPSGDGADVGIAPLAPSRQSAAVYRLIVQSPAPQELIPHVRSLFAERQVRERESSGRVMPGGVYFDGVTSVADYPVILREMQKLGLTKTYSNGASRNPRERARVIVWVQQI